MSQALRLSDSSTVISDSLYFDRRRHPRRKTAGQVSVVIREPGSDAQDPAKMMTLDLVDISNSGVGLSAQQPITIGSRITVFFPPHGAEPGFDLSGEVVRCKSSDNHHAIGIELDTAGGKQAG